jgi:hypothetical protein
LLLLSLIAYTLLTTDITGYWMFGMWYTYLKVLSQISLGWVSVYNNLKGNACGITYNTMDNSLRMAKISLNVS